MDYTAPVKATFELQRETIKSTQEALHQGAEFQQEFNQALLDGLDGDDEAQQRVIDSQREAILNTLDAVDSTLPGAEGATEEIRETVDEQFDQLLDNYEEVSENVTAELESGAESYEDLTVEYLDTLDEQLETVIEAHEDIEDQSVDAAEEVAEQLEELQKQVESVSTGLVEYTATE